MIFITLTRPDGSRIVINAATILSLTASPGGATAGPPGSVTRITFANQHHQDVQETIELLLEAIANEARAGNGGS